MVHLLVSRLVSFCQTLQRRIQRAALLKDRLTGASVAMEKKKS